MRYSPERSRRLFNDREQALLENLFSRRTLSHGQRLICSIACLQAAGNGRNLSAMLDLAISGVRDYRVTYEVLLQGYLFCGYPRAIESFFCLGDIMRGKRFSAPVISPKRLAAPAVMKKRGLKVAGLVYGDKFKKIHNKISALCPDLGYLMVMEGYGQTLCREELEIGARELAVVSSLSAMGTYRQLNSHIRGALNVGCKPGEVAEAILSGVPWLGPGAVGRSFEVWKEIIGLPLPNGAKEILAISV